MGTFSVLKIWSLWQKFPDEINAVQNIFVRPNWREIDLLVDYFNWQKSHNVHLSLRFVAGKMKFPTVEEKHKFLTNVTDIDCLENSLGEILRYTVYGHERLCWVNIDFLIFFLFVWMTRSPWQYLVSNPHVISWPTRLYCFVKINRKAYTSITSTLYFFLKFMKIWPISSSRLLLDHRVQTCSYC